MQEQVVAARNGSGGEWEGLLTRHVAETAVLIAPPSPVATPLPQPDQFSLFEILQTVELYKLLRIVQIC